MAIPMIESPIGAIGRGIGEGIQNVAAISNIQQNRERTELEKKRFGLEERRATLAENADTRAAAEEERKLAEWDQENAKTISLDEVIQAKAPNLDEVGKKFVWDKAGVLGWKPGKKVSLKELRTGQDLLFKDKEFVHGVFSHSDRALSGRINDAAEAGDVKAIIDLEQRQKNLRIGNDEWVKSKQMEDTVAHQKKLEEIAEMNAKTAEKRAEKADLHEKELRRFAGAQAKLAQDKFEFDKKAKTRDDARQMMLALGTETKLNELGQEVKDINPSRGLEKLWAFAPEIAKEGDMKQPPSGINWPTKWFDIDKKIGADPRYAEGVAAELVKMGFTAKDMNDTKYWEQKGLKNIPKFVLPYFPNPNQPAEKGKKQETTPLRAEASPAKKTMTLTRTVKENPLGVGFFGGKYYLPDKTETMEVPSDYFTSDPTGVKRRESSAQGWRY